MNLMIRRLIVVSLICLLGACAQQPVPTALPTPLPPTATGTPTSTPTPTRTPAPTPNIPRTEAADPEEQAYFRVIHAAAGVDAVDLYVEELNFTRGIEYGRFSDPAGITAGTYQISVVPLGGRLDGTLIQTSVTIAGGQSMLLIIHGTRAALTLTTLIEDKAPLPGNQTRLSVFNALPGTSGLTLIKEDNAAVTQPVNYGTASPITVIETLFYTFRAQLGDATVVTLPINLNGRRAYTVIVTGDIAVPESLQALVIETQVPGISIVRVIQAVRDVYGIDIYAGDILLGSGMGPGNDTNPMTIPAAVYDVTAYPTGADRATTQPLAQTQWFANADETVSIILAGDTTTQRFLFVEPDTRPTDGDTARILFVNAMPNTSRVQLSSEGTSDVKLSYGQISDPFVIPARITSFNWTDPDGTVLEFADSIDIQAGNSYLYILAGRGDSGAPILFSTFAGITVTVEDIGSTVATLTPDSNLRLVNAAPGTFVQFRLDDVTIVQSLAYTAENPPFVLEEGEHILTAHSQTGDLLARQFVTAISGTVFSAYVTGDEITGYNLIVITDIIRTAELVPYLRLVNLSQEDIILGAGYAPPTPSLANIVLNGLERLSVPMGVVMPISTIPAGNISDPVAVTGAAGARDLFLIETQQSQTLNIFPNVTLAAGRLYEMVAYQKIGSREIVSFVIPYTAP